MDTNKLKAFLCVAKHQNFTKASEELFISQPALSKKIADFENEINVQLLIRNNRSVILTPAGIALYNEAPPIMQIMNDLTKKIQDISNNPTNRLSIVCSGVEYGRFTPIINEFRYLYPHIAINLKWCSAPIVKHLLLSNMVDFGFQLYVEVEDEDDVEHIPFYHDELDIIVGPFHPLANSASLKYADMKKETYIAIKSSANHLPYNHILDYFHFNHINFEGGISVADSIDSLVLQVSAGLGISSLSHQVSTLYGNLVKFIPVEENSLKIETDLVWNKNNTNPTKKLFIDFIHKKNKEIELT